jgi:hypothetical protein
MSKSSNLIRRKDYNCCGSDSETGKKKDRRHRRRSPSPIFDEDREIIQRGILSRDVGCGGPCNVGCGGPCNVGYGGPCNVGCGGPCNVGYGGPCNVGCVNPCGCFLPNCNVCCNFGPYGFGAAGYVPNYGYSCNGNACFLNNGCSPYPAAPICNTNCGYGTGLVNWNNCANPCVGPLIGGFGGPLCNPCVGYNCNVPFCQWGNWNILGTPYGGWQNYRCGARVLESEDYLRNYFVPYCGRPWNYNYAKCFDTNFREFWGNECVNYASFPGYGVEWTLGQDNKFVLV